MASSISDSTIGAPVKRSDDGDTGVVKKVDEGREPRELPEIPLEMAKAQLGSAVRASIKRTDSAMKEFGDPGLVTRVCDGEVSAVLARIWAREDTRRQLVMALAHESGLFDVRMQIAERKAG